MGGWMEMPRFDHDAAIRRLTSELYGYGLSKWASPMVRRPQMDVTVLVVTDKGVTRLWSAQPNRKNWMWVDEDGRLRAKHEVRLWRYDE